ncbi:Inner membrane component of T3SS domain-containing protein [Anaerovirgula multivorans]|uniref:Inner membrane component of T3SS domain-containing protein n=1 Tax=Anaerovirgula multivorans TaxID=312168 RepID=A0A239C4G8_9FIRM|nr:FHA domain-containing protein [Anaerovirgula multivorans]SNS15147.1 Inner membrane component of T3SS domain-containing protein [Anaerovirgula multivorans]
MSLTRCKNGHMFSERRYGSICPYCNIETATKEQPQTPPDDFDIEDELLKEEIQPVCGWIVCVEGARVGKDYKIREGKNFIGRADDMDIQILGDNKISRRNHAIVVYDAKKRSYVLLPGDASGIAYLNDEAVYVPTPLSAYDVIELGKSKFLFMPFCGEHFEWDDTDRE